MPACDLLANVSTQPISNVQPEDAECLQFTAVQTERELRKKLRRLFELTGAQTRK